MLKKKNHMAEVGEHYASEISQTIKTNITWSHFIRRSLKKKKCQTNSSREYNSAY